MELKKITEEQRTLLKSPLPSEAIKQHPTKTYLSTIKAIYVVERLNDVFGVGEWKTKTEVITTVGKMVVVKSVLTINGYDVEVEAFGGNDNADLGDAYKGASTDALTKIGSYLEIGIDVFKGLGDTNEPTTEVPNTTKLGTKETTPKTDPKKSKIVELCKKLGFTGTTAKEYEIYVMGMATYILKPDNYDLIINKLEEKLNKLNK